MALTRKWSAFRLPQGWLDLVRQIGLFAGAYALYQLVRTLCQGDEGVAFQHAREIVNFERSAHLFFEPGLQHSALSQPGLISASNWLYLNSQFVFTITFLIWLYLKRNHAFYFVRNTFMISMGLALIVYVAFPTAPPRMLPEWGFTDTVANFAGQGASTTASIFYNPYAAIPSMHVAFALMVGIPATRLVRNKLLKVWWASYPLLMVLVVIVTANHFWIDSALGGFVAALSGYTAQATLGRARPEAWSWRAGLGARATA